MFMSDADKKRIKACPTCGSMEIRAPSLREGGVPGASEVAGAYYCERCGKKIAPIVFDDERMYKKFLKEVRK
jgi:DNA-directed RNA polymerase subunit RPC12/RpoP